ncbi:hypothetical protein BDP27DRAFT_1358838 [Rhodocollybia butyracea]|uniref:Uncharacterized protein n=1 Tax=Rhodocollybia butyracea TaxID=206335 RepID=A0A9P5UCF3_9AGAR|nr:hypothetical protein BDP27DRAFT_1358838 [Rhodocollybia butyracea]
MSHNRTAGSAPPHYLQGLSDRRRLQGQKRGRAQTAGSVPPCYKLDLQREEQRGRYTPRYTRTEVEKEIIIMMYSNSLWYFKTGPRNLSGAEGALGREAMPCPTSTGMIVLAPLGVQLEESLDLGDDLMLALSAELELELAVNGSKSAMLSVMMTVVYLIVPGTSGDCLESKFKTQPYQDAAVFGEKLCANL